MIETLQEHENSNQKGVTFRWQGMTISLVLSTFPPDGKKFLNVIAPDVEHAELLYRGNMEKWTTFLEALAPKDAGASTTSSGSALNVIGESTGG